MAEFVRIWDELAEVYVEYDITVEGGAGSGTGGTGTTIPVTPLNISSNVNTGVINKVIDTNDITASINSVDIAQIFRPVVIEKSSANRFTIQANIANQISVLARRDNLIVNTSGIGREGAQGEKGENSIITFNANLVYPEGSIVVFDGKIWISQSKLYGGVTPLSNPAENEFWSQIADQKYVDFLPLTSGYEVASQEEWDAIENTVELGDIIRVSNSAVDTIDIGTVNTDTEYTISDVGRALQDSSGRQYFVTGAFSGNEREIRATNREEITVADFEEALTLAGVVFGEDKLSGLNTAMNVGAEFANDSNNVFQITNVGTHTSTSVRVIFDPIAGSGPINVGFLSNTSPNVIGNKMYSGANPGVEISEAITNLVVGNRLHVVGEESSTTQNITKIEIVGGKTYFDIADYVGYDTGDKVIGRSISNETLVAGQWYVRNSNTVDKLRLDAIGPDVVLRADVSSLQNNFPTLTTNPGLVTANTRDRADNFFMNDGLDALGEYNQTAIPFTASHVSTLRFLLLKENGGKFDSNFSDPTDQEAQNLLLNNNQTFPETEQGAQVNIVKSVNPQDSNSETSGLILSTEGALSLNSTNTGGDGQGNKVIRLRSDGLIPPSVFGQVNLSATETFETTTDRNASTSRLLKMGDVAIITGDPAATDPFIGTFVFQSMDQTEALGSQNSDWIEIVTPTGAVASVAGKSGVVTLSTEDIMGLVIDKDAVSKDDTVTPIIPTQAGLLSISDKDKLDGIETGATADQTANDIRALTNISVTPGMDGTDGVDGLMSDADKFKLNSIETSATADQTAIDIRALSDISVTPGMDGTDGIDGLMSDADKFKLDGIETGSTSDQTAIDIRALTDISVTSGTDGTDGVDGLMSDADKFKLDGIETRATADQTATDIRALTDISVTSGTDGTDGVDGLMSDADKFKLDGIETGATADQTAIDIRALTDISVTSGTDGTDGVDGLMSDADKFKLDSIETSATADQTAIDIRALADISVTPGMDGTDGVDGLMSDADKFKLDGIETGATADQTAIDIRALTDISVTSGTDGTDGVDGLMSDADKFKLNNIETGATADQDAVSKNDSTDPITPTQAGLLSIIDKDKLDGIEDGADATPAWVPAGDPGYISGTAVSPSSVYFAVRLTNGNDLEIISYIGLDEGGLEVDEDINIEQLQSDGYELIEGLTSERISVNTNGSRTLRRIGDDD